jgi:ankyrin repeat protein/GNAT superfamily N-acetyltransferase
VIVMDARPVDLARARREAKALLRAARGGDAAALARVGTPTPQLSDAQLAVARELGARSWPALVRQVEAQAAAREELESALVLGDDERVRAELARDPGAASQPLGSRRWEPLLYVAYSEFLGGDRTEGLLACARALLNAGADPNAAWEDGEYERMTALHGAAGIANEPRMTALLLEAGADPDDGRSLRMAAGAEDPACLELLLDAGATLYRAMALAHAAQRGALRTARVLLERGPQQWGERENALVWAARGEAPAEMLRLLAEHGADLEASFDGTGRTPYGIAVRSGRRDLAEVLVSLGAQRRVEPIDELVGACLAGDAVQARRLAAEHPDAARLLRSSEADVLARAAGRGRREAVEALLDLGVPVDARGPMGETPLVAARECGHDEVAAVLLDRGADPRKRAPEEGDRGRTAEPLHADPRIRAPKEGGRDRSAEPRTADAGGRAPSGRRSAGSQTADAGGRAQSGGRSAEPPTAKPQGRAATGRSACEPPYAELAWAAETAYLRILTSSPLAETRPCGDGFAVLTGIEDNTENGVVCDRADDGAIAATLAWLAERGAPAQWLVGDSSDLGERLVVVGASAERTGVVMGAELDRLTLDCWAPEGVEVVAVRDEEGLAAWREVAGQCLFDDADERARLLASLGLGPEAPVQHRLAMRHGHPIGAATFLLHGETVFGQHLGVLAPERRGGVGRALAAHALREARAAGATVAVLGPTPDTVAFYRLLGFVLRPCLRDRSFYLPSR